jgi:hypothetical protein
VVEVVRESHTDPAAGRCDERGADDLGGLVVEADVVEGEIERGAGAADEVGDRVGDVERRLAAVGQQPESDRVAVRR